MNRIAIINRMGWLVHYVKCHCGAIALSQVIANLIGRAVSAGESNFRDIRRCAMRNIVSEGSVRGLRDRDDVERIAVRIGIVFQQGAILRLDRAGGEPCNCQPPHAEHR